MCALLAELQDVLQLVLPSEELYWLVYSLTSAVWQIAAPLLSAGFFQEILQPLALSVLALDTHIVFSLPKYLLWRVRLTCSLGHTFCSLGILAACSALAAALLNKVKAAAEACNPGTDGASAPAATEDPTKLATSQAACAELPLRLHEDLLCVSFNYRQFDLFDKRPDILTDATLQLSNAARSLIETGTTPTEAEPDLAEQVLDCLHSMFELVGLDDAVLRVSVAMRFAALLASKRDPLAAVCVLDQASRALEAARVSLLAGCVGTPDEAVRWIAASRSQPDAKYESLVTGMTETEQVLSCLHSELIALQLRLELEVGLKEQREAAERRKAVLHSAIERRNAQATIFGSRTMKERHDDALREQQAGQAPAYPANTHRKLTERCGENQYQQALLLIQAARLQPGTDKQKASFQDAADHLERLEASEAALFDVASQPASGRAVVPLPPLVLCRTPTSVTLTHNRLPAKAAAWSVLAKPFGSGVELALNSTSMELRNTGVQQPLRARITVEGLEPNETYIFAVVAFDAAGKLLGGVGKATSAILACLPLPLLHAWGQLALAASALRLYSLMERAMSHLLPHFIRRTNLPLLQDANPSDGLTLDMSRVEQAAGPLLRTFVQGLFCITHRACQQLEAHAADTPALPSQLKPQQQRLVACKQLLLGMRVACQVADQGLLAEAAVRFTNALAPLLLLPRSALLVQPLAACQVALADVRAAHQQKLKDEREACQQAGRAAACGRLYLLAGCDASREVDITAWCAKQESALLQASRSGPADTGDREVEAMQEALLAHPAQRTWAVPNLVERAAMPGDVVAVALSNLAAKPAAEVMAGLQADAPLRRQPRYVEMCVRVIEAALEAGNSQGVVTWAAEVFQLNREAFKVPHVAFDRWRPPEAAEQVSFKPLAAAEGTPEEQAEQQSASKRREAAARLLQLRLPKLFARRRQLLDLRVQLAGRQPWIARLHSLLGTMHLQRLQQERSAGSNKENVAVGNTAGKTAPPAAAKKGVAPVPAVQVSELKSEEVLLEVFSCFARAAECACRAEAWHEMLNACRHLWNCRYLLNKQPQLYEVLQVAVGNLHHLLAGMQAGLRIEAGVAPNGAAQKSLATQQLPTVTTTTTRPINAASDSDVVTQRWFERQSDVDMAWACKLVMAVLNVEHRMQRWHCVLQVATQFSSISEGAYSEQVLPYALQAAGALGSNASHFQLQLQDALRDKKQALDALEACRQLAAQRLASLGPLDQKPHQQTMRKRRMAGSAHLKGGVVTRTGSQDGSALIESPRMAESLASSRTGFTKSSQAISSRLPNEYNKTIEALREAGEKRLQILALNELGDVYAHIGQFEEAAQAWNDSLDLLLGPYQVLQCWRKHLADKSASAALVQYGCADLLLAGGILCGKLARCAYPANLGLQVEASRLGGLLLRWCFGSSLAHPQTPLGFAAYHMQSLAADTDLFADPYRCSAADLLSGTEAIAGLLLANGWPLDALPVVVMQQWLARHVRREVGATARACLLRGEALCQLGRLAEASDTICALMQGRGLPDHASGAELVMRDADGAVSAGQTVASFDHTKWPGHAGNKPCIDYMASQEVGPGVSSLLGPELAARLTRLRALFLCKLGEVVNCWQSTHPASAALAKLEQPLPANVEAACSEKAAALLQGLIAKLQAAAGGGGSEGKPGAAPLTAQQLTQSGTDADPDTERSHRSHHAQLWLDCRLQACEVLLQLGQLRAGRALLGVTQAEASASGHRLAGLALQSLQASLDALEGHTNAALEGYQQVTLGYSQLGARTATVAGVLVLNGQLLERCRKTAESQAAYQAAVATLVELASQHGLPDALAFEEMRNVYLPLLPLLLKAQTGLARQHLQARQAQAAAELAAKSAALLPLGRSMPGMHVEVGLLMARCYAGQAAAGHADDAAEALSWLERAISWAAADGAGVCQAELRAALLALAGLHITAGRPSQACAALRSAQAVAAGSLQLMQNPGAFTAPAAPVLPSWLQSLLPGAEGAATAAGGKQSGGAPGTPAAELWRSLVLYYVGLLRTPTHGSLLASDRAAAQAMQIHALLRDQCPAYKTRCCLAGIPVPPQDAPAPPPSSVVMQWALAQATSSSLVPLNNMSLLFTIQPDSQPILAGTCTAPLTTVRQLRRGCQAVREKVALASGPVPVEAKAAITTCLGHVCSMLRGIARAEPDGDKADAKLVDIGLPVPLPQFLSVVTPSEPPAAPVAKGCLVSMSTSGPALPPDVPMQF
ncbi:hypothetical protein WJX72_009127 [[Myrmecia] bisecta]|uniref:Fibronectin type-III domain-containing protein n=1 Tax=[Myrmecia] bisecta TaxID=41462 RepID=A0AAW1P9B3_9CHLO